MTWNPSLPTGATKLRSAPGLITTNWTAIQNGTVPHVKLMLAKQAGAPTSVANRGFLYTKQSNTKTELFYVNDNSETIQITRGGKIANTDVQLLTSGISFDDSLFYEDGQLVVAYGYFSDAGVLQFGKNMATNGTPHPATGQYVINVNADVLTTDEYIVVGIIFDGSFTSGTSAKSLNLRDKPAPVAATATEITVEVRQESGRANFPFMVMICGGR